jgi:hypothetical protein
MAIPLCISGRTGFVTFGDGVTQTTLCASEWSNANTVDLVDVTNYCGNDVVTGRTYQQMVTSIPRDSLTISGPFLVGQAVPVDGDLVVFIVGNSAATVGTTNGNIYSDTFLVESIELDLDVADAYRYTITASSTVV